MPKGYVLSSLGEPVSSGAAALLASGGVVDISAPSAPYWTVDLDPKMAYSSDGRAIAVAWAHVDAVLAEYGSGETLCAATERGVRCCLVAHATGAHKFMQAVRPPR